MTLNNENVNQFLDKYTEFVNKVSNMYNYEDNIRHLLYLIVPSFIVKYDFNNEATILKCFEDTRIYITGSENKIVAATFNREIFRNNASFSTRKYILLNEYRSSSLSGLLDSIVHEFNHAVNSINNEISFNDDVVKLRTGLSYLIYDKKTLNFISKSKEVALEEVINTEQTEEIINIINSFNNYNINNIEFNNMLYALNSEIKNNTYTSDAYYFQSYICDELMKNKTFTPTISSLRFKGFVEDIPYLFDNVIGKDGSYKKLNSLLEELYDLEVRYSKAKWFKSRILNKIKGCASEIISLIREYDSKCIYK